MKRIATVAAALGMAFAATTAQAGDGDTTVPVNGRNVGGDLYSPVDYHDLTFPAVAGKDLFIGFGTAPMVKAQIYDPFGVLVASYETWPGYKGSYGLELRPKMSGTYKIHVTPKDTTFAYPQFFTLWVQTDCRTLPDSGCVIKSGETRKGVWGAANDSDRFIIVAPRGKRYVATLTITGGYQHVVNLYVSCGINTNLGIGTATNWPNKNTPAVRKFTLPASQAQCSLVSSPTYVIGNDDPLFYATGQGTYTISLKQLP